MDAMDRMRQKRDRREQISPVDVLEVLEEHDASIESLVLEANVQAGLRRLGGIAPLESLRRERELLRTEPIAQIDRTVRTNPRPEEEKEPWWRRALRFGKTVAFTAGVGTSDLLHEDSAIRTVLDILSGGN